MKIQCDLESTPLYISTNSKIGSYDLVRVNFYAGGRTAGGLLFSFRSPPKYNLMYCSQSTWTAVSAFPSSPRDRVLRITLIRTSSSRRLLLHCNGIQVLNVLLSDTECNDVDWESDWSRDVKQIMFNSNDEASDFYSSDLSISPGKLCRITNSTNHRSARHTKN